MKLFCLQNEGMWVNVDYRPSSEKVSLKQHEIQAPALELVGANF
jgi:hypothetical protein